MLAHDCCFTSFCCVFAVPGPNAGAIAGGVLGGLGGLALLICGGCFCFRKGYCKLPKGGGNNNGATGSNSDKYEPGPYSPNPEVGGGSPGAGSLEMRLQRLLSVGVHAANFKALKCLGSGANGAVLLCQCTLPGNPAPHKLYALKVIYNLAGTMSRGRRNRFLAEFQQFTKMDPHPNIVRFWCSFVDDIPAEAMDMLPADMARELRTDEYGLQRNRIPTQFGLFDYHPQTLAAMRLAGPEILQFTALFPIGRQLFQGARYLDANNVLHRDMKMENVLVSDNGDVLLCDLGEALSLVTPASYMFVSATVNMSAARE